jgi:subtilisin family serine protease
MVWNRLFLLLGVFLFVSSASGQVNRYMVFFTDKNNTEYSIDRPEEFLSERAIQRRLRQNIPIIEEDLPVNNSYTDSLESLGITTFFRSRWFNAVLVQTNSSNVGLIRAQGFIEAVEYVAPGAKLASRSADTEEEEERTESFGELSFNKFQNNSLGVPAMHQNGFAGQNMLIGVLDGGFSGTDNIGAFNHLFNEDRIVDEFDFVRNNRTIYEHSSHGTQVLSCMAAIETDVVVGTAPYADYLLYITEDDGPEHRIEEYNWLFAAEKADSMGVDVINTSVGYYDFDDPSMNYTKNQFDGQTTVITRAAQKTAEKGIVVVCSGGNEGNDPWDFLTAPADAKDILAVGAIRSDSTLTSFSSPGPTTDGRIKPDVVALGSSVTVASSAGTSRVSGTSFSAPLVAGLVAGFWQAEPELTAKEVVERIRNSGHRVSLGSVNNNFGYGIPSFTRLTGLTPIDDPLLADVKIYPNPVERGVFYIETGSFFNGNTYQANLYDLGGVLILNRSVLKNPGEGRETFFLDGLAPGNYILKLTDGVKDVTSRIVKR